MKVEVLEKNTEKVYLRLKETSRGFANSLRRLILEEVPTMAIDDVEFHKNDSVLYDEIIAHRLGLIPLKTDLDSYEFPEECSCGGVGCARCQVSLTLSRKGGDINSKDLESQDPEIVPAFENIAITKLSKDQKIELITYARLGKGKTHAKWAPGFTYFRPAVEIKDIKEVKDICPKKLFKDGKINKEEMYKCDLCGLCEEQLGAKLDEKNDEFIFYFENFGQLKNKNVFIKAADILNEKVKDFREALIEQE